MLSIKEVARRTGLSTATVSRALDPRYADKVKPETRAKILAVCDSGNYRPGIAGRSFATGKSYKVGFISGEPAVDLGNLFQGYFFQGAGFELQKAGYSLLLLCAPDNEEKNSLVIDFLRSGVADAYILGNSLITDGVAQAIAECKVPVLNLLRNFSPADFDMSISNDLRSAYAEIWRRMPEQLRSQTVFCYRKEREAKYDIASELALPEIALPGMLIETSNNFAEVRSNAYSAACRNLDQLLSYKVFWCSSDLMALGIKDALEETGLIAGKDFYLIGYDDIEGLPTFTGTPFLSTVSGLWEEQGVIAAQMVLDALNGKNPGDRVITLKYISRKSFPF